MGIKTKETTVSGVPAYHAFPDDGEHHPGLVLIEEVWGVNAHIRSVAERLAGEGFSVISPELLPEGLLAIITPELQEGLFNPEKRNEEVQPKLRAAMEPTMQPEYAKGAVATLKACVDYLNQDEGVNGKIGVIGFCFGGTYSFHLAAQDQRILAAVPFYGQPPATDELSNITCPVLAFYGDQDQRLMETLPALKERMSAAQKDFTPVVYPGVGHAFFNDTNERMYSKDAAEDAWNRLLPFLREKLT